MRSIKEVLIWSIEYLEKHQIEDAHLESEILLAHTLNLKRTDIYSYPERSLSPREWKNYQATLARRAKHEPIAYITGYQPFMNLIIKVDRNVLIPRPETELLVEEAIETINRRHENLIYDIGTGSGVIAIALAKDLLNTKVIGVDPSKAALKVARENAQANQVEQKCKFVEGDLFEPLTNKADLIISNPPYIPTKEIEKLESDVKDWEPRVALDGGKDGLKYIKPIISQAPDYLKPNGILIFEFGFGQAKEIRRLISENKYFESPEIGRDYAGIERILIVRTRINP